MAYEEDLALSRVNYGSPIIFQLSLLMNAALMLYFLYSVRSFIKVVTSFRRYFFAVSKQSSSFLPSVVLMTICPPIAFILSCSKITTPPNTTLMTIEGLLKALISFKCYFLSFLTSASVIQRDALASATEASASAAKAEASAFCAFAIFSYADTTICTSSAQALSTVSFSISFCV